MCLQEFEMEFGGFQRDSMERGRYQLVSMKFVGEIVQ
jgi:hypothetical protein